MMIRHFSRTSLLLSSLCAALWAVEGWSSGLDDTGQLQCYDAKGKGVDCAQAQDDGRYGRDAAASAGRVDKIGRGKSGFDFTKIANDGSELPFSAQLGKQPGDWACTRDNVTGLMWEVKTASPDDLRFVGHGFWHPDEPENRPGGGNAPGSLNLDACRQIPLGALCSAPAYVATVNATGLCGFSDWRMPVLPELQSLVDYGARQAPFIDTEFFPNTAAKWHWVQDISTSRPAGEAWGVHFGMGVSGVGNKSAQYAVRLVRKTR